MQVINYLQFLIHMQVINYMQWLILYSHQDDNVLNKLATTALRIQKC